MEVVVYKLKRKEQPQNFAGREVILTISRRDVKVSGECIMH